MNIDDILWRLAQLASLPFQERYIISATESEYFLDTELLENVDGLKYLLKIEENRNLVNRDQIVALEELFSFIENSSGEALSAGSREEGALIIREGAVWKSLREKASYALSLFDFSVEKMTAEEVNNLVN
jgi:hypothetical protein